MPSIFPMSIEHEDISTNQQVDISASVRKKVSIVWRYFEKLDRLRVRCKLCRHVQNYQGTTGNILRHLKNKHNIDATLKGQRENPGLVEKYANEIKNSRLGDEDSCNNFIDKEVSTDVSAGQQKSDCKVNIRFSRELLDPYTDSTFQLYDYTDDPSGKNTTQDSAVKQKYSVEEERIMAEIEYFREKAGYYRMQKNLVALQAKRIRYELQQL